MHKIFYFIAILFLVLAAGFLSGLISKSQGVIALSMLTLCISLYILFIYAKR